MEKGDERMDYTRLTKYLGIILTCFSWYGCGDSGPQAPPPGSQPVPVNLYETKFAEVHYFDEYPGTAVPLMQVDIRPQVEGYVTDMYFTEGTRVKKGQRLYAIDMSKYSATKNQSETNIRVAEANVEQAQKDADRYTYLNEHEAIAKQTLDHALTALQNAKNHLVAAKQELIKAQTNLGYAVIKAPFDGLIGISQVRVGNSVVPGQTIMNTISSADGETAVDFVINEKKLGPFLKMQQNGNHDSTFSLLLPDNTKFDQYGAIHIIDRGVNSLTGAITVRLKFPDPKGMLRPGMSCKVRVQNQDKEPRILIPNKAVVEQMGEYFVYEAKDTALPAQGADTAKGKDIAGLYAIQKKVELGVPIGAMIVVKSGLAGGEKIVAEGVQKLRNGVKIAAGPLVAK